jgi:hypothetical protein
MLCLHEDVGNVNSCSVCWAVLPIHISRELQSFARSRAWEAAPVRDYRSCTTATRLASKQSRSYGQTQVRIFKPVTLLSLSDKGHSVGQVTKEKASRTSIVGMREMMDARRRSTEITALHEYFQVKRRGGFESIILTSGHPACLGSHEIRVHATGSLNTSLKL